MGNEGIIRIEGLLRDNPQGLTIKDLSERTKLHRQTVRVILSKLEGEKKILVRELGNARLSYWNFDWLKEKEKQKEITK